MWRWLEKNLFKKSENQIFRKRLEILYIMLLYYLLWYQDIVVYTQDSDMIF